MAHLGICDRCDIETFGVLGRRTHYRCRDCGMGWSAV